MRTELNAVTERVSLGETLVASLEALVQAVEQTQAAQDTAAQEMQLHLEEMEDRSCRNNLRLRGIPEAMGSEERLQQYSTASWGLSHLHWNLTKYITPWVLKPQILPDHGTFSAACTDTHRKKPYYGKHGSKEKSTLMERISKSSRTFPELHYNGERC